MLTNAERAAVEPAKERNDLLSPSHPVGRFKDAVFASLGCTQENWNSCVMFTVVETSHFQKQWPLYWTEVRGASDKAANLGR
jgi:hypothetical protein